jgi:beta-galactosidase
MRIFWVIFSALFVQAAAFSGTASVPAPRFLPWANTTLVNEDWEYFEEPAKPPAARANASAPANAAAPVEADDGPDMHIVADAAPPPPAAKWRPVSLPHSWNAEDTVQKAAYRRAVSWYRRVFRFSESDLRESLFLRFGAAGQQAVVYINEEEVLVHKGGYSAFVVPLDGHVRAGENTVLVRVSNARDLSLPPLSGDFNQYGGLYREARLLRAPRPLAFARDEHGGPGARMTSRVTAGKAGFDISLSLSCSAPPAPETAVALVLAAPDGSVVFQKNTALAPAFGGFQFAVSGAVDNPVLWSPDSPALYTLTARLLDKRTGAEIDRVSIRHGFRWYEFTPDKGFFLNGKRLKLRGVSRHQDFPGRANALDDARHDADLRAIKETGFNFLRLAHYQQDDYVLQRCDELGLLVWEEIPLVNVIAPRNHPVNPALAENALSMQREMIFQHANHPCVILWGLGNEISYSLPADDPARSAFELGLLRELQAQARRLDPSRKTILASHDSDRASDVGAMSIPDLAAYNLYRGWYRENTASLSKRLRELHDKNPAQPLILSEFGAAADTWIHSETPRRFDHSEEHMVNVLEASYDQFDAPALDWLAAHILWVFADFGAAHRIDTHPYINNKGLLDIHRQPKDAHFYLKARLQREHPVLHLQSPSWTERGGAAEKIYRVFSNMDTVELFHDGVSLGKQTAGYRWRVTLRPGANALLAKGANKDGAVREHGFTVNYSPDRAPRVAPVMPKR